MCEDFSWEQRMLESALTAQALFHLVFFFFFNFCSSSSLVPSLESLKEVVSDGLRLVYGPRKQACCVKQEDIIHYCAIT